MDCSSDDMGYQKRGRTRSHELNMVVVVELLGRVFDRLVFVLFVANLKLVS